MKNPWPMHSNIDRFLQSFFCVNIDIFLVSLFVSLAFSIGVLNDLIRLELWSQVVDIWNAHSELATSALLEDDQLQELSLAGHLLRYQLIRPIFLFSRSFGFNYNDVYSSLLPIMTFISVFIVGTIASKFQKKIKLASALALIAWSFIFLFMDGRMPLAFLGTCLLMAGVALPLSHIYIFPKIFIILIGAWLCSVTSGVFVATIAFLILCITLDSYRYHLSLLYLMYATFTLFSLYYFFGYYFWDGLIRSLSFYGTGLESILNAAIHGYGRFIGELIPLPMAIIIMIIILLMMVFVIRKFIIYIEFIQIYSILLIFLTAFLGIWGTSILSLSLIPIAILTLSVLQRAFFAPPNYKLDTRKNPLI